MKRIGRFLLPAFAVLLCFSAVFSAGVAMESFVPTASAADMLSDGDRPDVAVSVTFRSAVRGFMNYFLGFLGLFAVVMLVYAGILMVSAQGEDEPVQKAKKIILWSVAGIVLVLLSYAIVSLVVDAGNSIA